jgi:hypothetical protein
MTTNQTTQTNGQPATTTPGAPPTVVGATGSTGTQVLFGVTFVLNGQQVPVYAKDITNAATNGVEFTLPQPIDLGTFNDFAAWFKTQFGVDIPSTSTLPPPLDQIAGQLASLDVSVDMLHVKVPPAAPPGQSRAPTQYTVALRAVFPGTGFDLIPGLLQIQGAVFGVSNENK